ncbi:MAG: 16S rRNA (cytidine(1402)-2'-O)-methyltransferase [Coxiellaceae bacterium]|nr:16S rRNA (cytidine(1402)-2'-O)-methyltransferase [Coxiellaceae bacterium]
MLYLVATPIGNLLDITLRAIETLKRVDFIAAEDTRHSARLLTEYDIRTPCFSLHDHNEDARIKKILQILQEKKSIALISDAGTPLISDPGFKIVRAVREKGFGVTAIPGACAAIAALITSGLATDRFIFDGFLPAKRGAIENYFEAVKNETRTLIFYESVHRIKKTLEIMRKIIGGDRIATVARELTKTFETIKQDSLETLCHWILEDNQQRGEFVIVLEGAPLLAVSDEKITDLLKILLTELSVKQAVSIVCKLTGCNKNTAYALGLLQKPD